MFTSLTPDDTHLLGLPADEGATHNAPPPILHNQQPAPEADVITQGAPTAEDIDPPVTEDTPEDPAPPPGAHLNIDNTFHVNFDEDDDDQQISTQPLLLMINRH